MHKTYISNSTCLIGFERINSLDILQKLYGEIFISEAVGNETGLTYLSWIKVRKIKNKEALRFLMLEIDQGEAETIILATEIKNAVLILDEKKARKIAKRLDLNITGLMGVLLKAKEKGIIKSVKEIIENLEKENFRISVNLKKKCISICNEI